MRTIAYCKQIDGLRAIAIISVILFHFNIPHFEGGFTGVDIFFVISGFLVTSIIVRNIELGKFSFIEFYLRRARRLLPALFITILLTGIIAFLIFSPIEFELYAKSSIFSVLFSSNISFWLESGYFDANKYTKPLLHTWSLSVEEQFYLIWPLLLFVLVRNIKREYVIFLIFAISILSFLAMILASGQYLSATFFLAPFRIWQFGAGALVALISLRTEKLQLLNTTNFQLSTISLLLGFMGVIYSAFFVNNSNYPGFQSIIPTLGAVLIIVGRETKIAQYLIGNGPAVYIGKISYSLYLVHWPIIVFVKTYFGPSPSIIIICLAMATSVILSSLIYYTIELPLKKPWNLRNIKDAASVPVFLMGAASLLVLFHAYVWVQNGLAWRITPQQRSLMAASRQKFNCDKVPDRLFGDICQIGVQKSFDYSNSVLIMGDSHAESLSLGLDPLLARQNKSGLMINRSATIPLLSASTFDGEKMRPLSFDPIYNALANSPVKPVIIHARWALHWNTFRPAYESSSRKFVGLNKTRPSSVEESQNNLVLAFERSLEFLKQHNKSVIVLGAVPYQGTNVSHCLSRPQYIISNAKMASACGSFDKKDALKRAATINNVLKEITQKYGFIFLNPFDVLCAQTGPSCTRYADGKLLYRDDDHVNQFGAEILAGLLAKPLENLN